MPLHLKPRLDARRKRVEAGSGIRRVTRYLLRDVRPTSKAQQRAREGHMPHRSASTVAPCKPACRPSESVGSLLGLWLIDTWSEPS